MQIQVVKGSEVIFQLVDDDIYENGRVRQDIDLLAHVVTTMSEKIKQVMPHWKSKSPCLTAWGFTVCVLPIYSMQTPESLDHPTSNDFQNQTSSKSVTSNPYLSIQISI